MTDLRAERIRREWEKTHRLLLRTGFFDMVRRWGHTRPDYMPDLSVPPHPVPLGCGFGPLPGRRAPLPPDAIEFPVGHSHKQGMELITSGSDPRDYRGRKT